MSSLHSFALEGALTIPRAAELQATLRDQIEAGTTRLDLSAVTECDASGIQLLLAMRRSLEMSGQRLQLEAISPSLGEALTRCGLEDLAAAA